jgi:hypothetical protein
MRDVRQNMQPPFDAARARRGHSLQALFHFQLDNHAKTLRLTLISNSTPIKPPSVQRPSPPVDAAKFQPKDNWPDISYIKEGFLY